MRTKLRKFNVGSRHPKFSWMSNYLHRVTNAIASSQTVSRKKKLMK